MNILVKHLSKNRILDLLQKIDSRFIPHPLSAKVDLILYSEKLAKYAIHFSVEDNNKLIGLCCCYMNDPEKERAFISITCVDPDYSGKGLGKKLTQKCEEYAKNCGYKFIEFEVHTKNIPSIQMHKTIGYHIDRQVNESFYMKKII